jgi:Na+-driven multidrug efflux pump
LITLTIGTFDSILRGSGNVRIPALCSTLSLGLRFVFTPLFMFPLGLGLIGAPLAALTGNSSA